MPTEWPYGAHLFEADSNGINAVPCAQSPPYSIESGRMSPDTSPDMYLQVTGSRSFTTLLEQPHQRKLIENSQSGLQSMGSRRSTSLIDYGDVARPGGAIAQRSKQVMQSGGSLPPTPNVEQPLHAPLHAELPGKARTSVGMVEQPPCLTTGDEVSVAVPPTLQLTLPSRSPGGPVLSGCDQPTIQDQTPRQRLELHAASERDAQRIREAHKEIERLRGENVILRNQLHDNVRVSATHATSPSLVSIHSYIPYARPFHVLSEHADSASLMDTQAKMRARLPVFPALQLIHRQAILRNWK